MKGTHVPRRFFGRESETTQRFHVGDFKEGMLKIWKEGPLWVTQIKGYASVEMAIEGVRDGTEFGDAHGMIVVVHDWFEATSADMASRVIMQRFAEDLREKGQLREIVIAIDSVILRMSIAAANIVLGNSLEGILDYKKFLQRFEELHKKYVL
ncbi:MAG: hypothetical protein MUC50_13695 [Myxococcota bacterium]|jgi:hypothetical protein|nr:hypothetical protein [Myxococcota bacterium]